MYSSLWEKLENDNKFQTILLVSTVSKLFRKLRSQAHWTRFWCSKSSSRDSISMTKTRVPQRDFKPENHKEQIRKNQITNNKSDIHNQKKPNHEQQIKKPK